MAAVLQEIFCKSQEIQENIEADEITVD